LILSFHAKDFARVLYPTIWPLGENMDDGDSAYLAVLVIRHGSDTGVAKFGYSPTSQVFAVAPSSFETGRDIAPILIAEWLGVIHDTGPIERGKSPMR